MYAISIKQPWAWMIASGEKTIETRTWTTPHRGDLLIVSSKQPADQGPAGVALCVVRLVECRAMRATDEEAACCEIYDGACAWVLEDIRRLVPFPVRGQQGLYRVELPARGGCDEGRGSACDTRKKTPAR